ncbi:MAG: type II toxin-antitoxin system HipA family toxin [Pseudomonadota bacterium]
MKLNVFVHGRHVAILESADGFEHQLTYLPGTSPDDFVSLTMPVQTPSWTWPTLHPFFQVSLPEGFLLSVLKEQLGPHLGASPLDLLSVVGHNLIGRVQVSAGTQANAVAAIEDLGPLLHGSSSPRVFLELMARYAASGVSGVVPKFLTPETEALFRKGSLATERHIVKASSEHQPFVALNEHLCMQAAAATGVATARTIVSDDGQVLIIERFDIDAETGKRKGFEDFCSLLGLPPEQKYNSTWERVARLVRDYVPAAGVRAANEQLAVVLLLSHALGNADCHTKNLAFLYDDFDNVAVAPIYDMLSILAYDQYAHNPPGMFLDGRKRWDAPKALWRYLQQHLGIEPARQRVLVDRVCSAVAQTVPSLMQHIRHTAGFAEIGLRMLWEWNEGMKRLSDRRTFALSDWIDDAEAQGLPRRAPASL